MGLNAYPPPSAPLSPLLAKVENAEYLTLNKHYTQQTNHINILFPMWAAVYASPPSP